MTKTTKATTSMMTTMTTTKQEKINLSQQMLLTWAREHHAEAMAKVANEPLTTQVYTASLLWSQFGDHDSKTDTTVH